MLSKKTGNFVLDQIPKEIGSALRNIVREISVTSPWREQGKLEDEEIESITQHLQQVLLEDVNALLSKKSLQKEEFLQKTGNVFLPSFSPKNDSVTSENSSIAPEMVNTFLKHVVNGNEDEVETLLKKTTYLALASGDISDHANREFQGITGFQYAVWALDWHMWETISKYIPLEILQEQLEQCKTGSWVEQYGEHVSWQELLDKQESYLLSNYKFNLDEKKHFWNLDVGSEQFKLPKHVLQEYCQPKRPFIPCPDFTTTSLIRVEVDVESLGCQDGFPEGLSRGREWDPSYDKCRSLPSEEVIEGDREALSQLLGTRLMQRKDLFDKLGSALHARMKRDRKGEYSDSSDSEDKNCKRRPEVS